MVFCINCGTAAGPDQRFCIACGTKLVFPVTPPQASAGATSRAPTSPKGPSTTGSGTVPLNAASFKAPAASPPPAAATTSSGSGFRPLVRTATSIGVVSPSSSFGSGSSSPSTVRNVAAPLPVGKMAENRLRFERDVDELNRQQEERLQRENEKYSRPTPTWATLRLRSTANAQPSTTVGSSGTSGTTTTRPPVTRTVNSTTVAVAAKSSPSAAEIQKKREEEQRQREEEERQQQEAEQRKIEEEQERLAAEQRRLEAVFRKQEEEARRQQAEEARRLAEEQRRQEEEEARLLDEQQRAAAAAEQQAAEEQRRLLEEKKAELRRLEEQKRQEEQRKREEAERLKREEIAKEKERLQQRAAELQRKKEEEEQRRREAERKKQEEADRRRKEAEEAAAAAALMPTSFEAPDVISTHKKAVPLSVSEAPDLGEKKQKRTHSRIIRDNASRNVRSLDVEGLEAPKKPAASSGGGIAAQWAQKMAAKKEDEYQTNRTKRKGRVNGGIQFMDNQIRQLIVEIVKLGKTSPQATPGGRAGIAPSVNYLDLFNATQAHMPALSAALLTAKKRGVVIYEGDMLMQGFHDDVIITLLKDEIEDSPEFKSRIIMRPSGNAAPEAHVPARCAKCTKLVYPMERLCANEVVFHKGCFRCQVCDRKMELKAYAFLDGKFYCEPDFEKIYKKNASYLTGFKEGAAS